MCEKMEKFKIGNLWVHFPFVPYRPQEEFMKKMVDSLENAQNALLESPTGTGKTLCLLCASLAWIDSKRKAEEILRIFPDGLDDSVRNDEQNDEEDDEGNRAPALNGWEERNRPKKYKIYFCTRTHSQIMQAVKEFQNCGYGHLRSTVLGSRRHLCINPSAKQPEGNLDNRCRALRREAKMPSGEKCTAPGPDIEDLPKKCTSCHKDHKCPYYVNYQNMLEEGKDHVFTKAGAFDQKGLIEKCKKEKVCPFYVSRHLQKYADIVFLPYSYIFNPHILRGLQLNLKDAILIIDEGHNLEKVCEENASFDMKVSDIENCRDELNNTLKFFNSKVFKDLPPDISESVVLKLDNVMFKLKQSVEAHVEAGSAYTGQYCQVLFTEAGLEGNDRHFLLYSLKQLIQYSAEKEEKTEAMRKMNDVISTVFDHSDTNTLQDSFVLYKEVIKPEEEHTKEPKIFFWCFEAGVIMRSLQERGVHSFIVTSGTLSPLNPLKKSLSIPFEVELINQHVVDDSQVLGLCMGRAHSIGSPNVTSVALDASFKNRERNGHAFYAALGHVVLKVAAAVPKGLLIFFPSSKVKKDCLERWDNVYIRHGKSLSDAINDLKVIYEEPQVTNELPKLQEVYSSKITDPTCNGACLIGVLSGKVSEGIDFKDDLGRAVIMIGLPYPPPFDPWVKHKRQHLNRKNGSHADSEWYLSQAIRPVNQALGRIIRHQSDYGVVLLADMKYMVPPNGYNYKVIKSLPAWLERGLECVPFAGLPTRLTQFFSGIPSKLEEIKKKTEEEQIRICERHREAMKKETFDGAEYHELIKLRDIEREKEKKLIAEVINLDTKVREALHEVRALREEADSQIFKEWADVCEMDSDCESNGESEWDAMQPSRD